MKQLGVEYLISASAVGSLKEEAKPLDMVVPDQFIDRTKNRISTFFGEGIVAHITFGDPVCDRLAGVLAEAIASLNLPNVTLHRGGTYVCMEGPQFSSLAESMTYKGLGYDVIGMTNMPEAKLAREAEITYATIAMVTDYDCWHPDHEDVDVAAVVAVAQQNAAKVARLVARLAKDFPAEHEPCPARSDRALDGAIMTAPSARDPELLRKLDAVAGRVLASAKG